MFAIVPPRISCEFFESGDDFLPQTVAIPLATLIDRVFDYFSFFTPPEILLKNFMASF